MATTDSDAIAQREDLHVLVATDSAAWEIVRGVLGGLDEWGCQLEWISDEAAATQALCEKRHDLCFILSTLIGDGSGEVWPVVSGGDGVASVPVIILCPDGDVPPEVSEIGMGEVVDCLAMSHVTVPVMRRVVGNTVRQSRAVRHLRASEEKYRTLIENVNIGVYRATGGSEGRFLYVNPALVKMFGYETADEMMTLRVSDTYQDPKNRARFIEELNREGHVRSRELKLVRCDGAPMWGAVTARVERDEEGGISWINGVIEDITEQKETELEILKYKTIVDTACAGTAIADLEGNLIYVNAAYAEMHGEEPEYFIGRHLSSTHPPEEMPHVNDLLDVLQRDGVFVAERVWHRRVDGEKFPSIMSAAVVPNEQGDPLYLTATLIDISKREHAEKLAALGMTASGLAHYIKNLQTHLAASARVLDDAMQHRKTAVADRAWPIVRRSLVRISELVRNMLAIAHQNDPAREPEDLNTLVTQLVEDCRSQAAEEGVALRAEVAERMPLVCIDYNRIHDSVLNILSNAIESFQAEECDGGEVIVRTRHMSDLGWAAIEIQDTGPGIEEEALAQIFEPFFTTKGSKGTGLGLAVVKKAIDEHSGQIKIHAPPEGGTVFTILLPTEAVAM